MIIFYQGEDSVWNLIHSYQQTPWVLRILYRCKVVSKSYLIAHSLKRNITSIGFCEESQGGDPITIENDVRILLVRSGHNRIFSPTQWNSFRRNITKFSYRLNHFKSFLCGFLFLYLIVGNWSERLPVILV